MTHDLDVQRQVFVYKSTYGDSSILTSLTSQLNEQAGIIQAMTVMGTPLNRRLLEASGFDGFECLNTATPMDLIVAICAEPGAPLKTIRDLIEKLLSNSCQVSPVQPTPAPHKPQHHHTRTIEDTCAPLPSPTAAAPPDADLIQLIDITKGNEKPLPEAGTEWPPLSVNELLLDNKEINVVSIAVPGPYAAYVAERAIDAGKHVFLFSSRVSMEDEINLKQKATQAGLLMMGPACGTAMISGTVFGFGSPIPRGNVGIIGGGSTGGLEIATILNRGRMGISHHLGSGTNDVNQAVGGLGTIMGLRLLATDPHTKSIIIINRKPAPKVLTKIHDLALKTGKEVIIRLTDVAMENNLQFGNVYYASSLYDAAMLTNKSTGKPAYNPRNAITKYDTSVDPVEVLDGPGKITIDGKPTINHRPNSIQGKRLIALMSGGASTSEVSSLLMTHKIHSTMPLFPIDVSINEEEDNRFPMEGLNLVIDTSRNCYLITRQHPIIDLQLRVELAELAASDPKVGVLLFDLVLGHGAHHNPAPVLIGAIKRGVKRRLRAPLEVVFNVMGTPGVPQNLEKQREDLLTAGFHVVSSTVQAVKIVATLLETINE